MTSIKFGEGEILIDARTVAEGLGIKPDSVPQLMRDGRITSLCERGAGEDEGRIRLTFYSGNRRCRLVVDEAGDILQRSKINYGELPMRRASPGAPVRP